MKEEKSVKHV
jgi:hypothetical protein